MDRKRLVLGGIFREPGKSGLMSRARPWTQHGSMPRTETARVIFANTPNTAADAIPTRAGRGIGLSRGDALTGDPG